MFRHYLIVALRHFRQHRLYSLINVAGLAVGLAAAILILLFVRDEISYDTWIPDTKNMYRVELTFHPPGRPPWRLAQAPFPIATAMRAEIPQVEAMTHVVPEDMTVSIGDRQFPETVTFVDRNFFQVIRLALVEGNPATVLSQPESVVLSERIARKYFGKADPIGRLVHVNQATGYTCGLDDVACLNSAYPLTVTGVLRDLPHNTQLVVDLVVSNSSKADALRPEWKEQGWTSGNDVYSYVVLAPGTKPSAVLSQLKPILDRSVNPHTSDPRLRGSNLEEIHLTPFSQVHLVSDQYGGMRPGAGGSWTVVYGLATIAGLLVLVACFNFMNLATARATLRAREISLRKVVGAKRQQLIVQFLGESVLTALLALVVALVMVEIALPAYDRFLGRTIEFRYLTDWRMSLGIIAGVAGVGLVSGIYPALVLSGFRPAAALKAVSPLTSSGFVRAVLVVFQFAVSIGLGIAAIVVFSQIRFVRSLDLGFRQDGVVIVKNLSRLTPAARENLARRLDENPDVVGTSLSNAVPFDTFNTSNPVVRFQGDRQSVTAHIVDIDPNFPGLYDMPIVAGRRLSSAYGGDEAGKNVLVNAALVRRLGYRAERAVGKSIVLDGNRVTVAGVLGDAKLDGVKDPVLPAIYVDDPAGSSLLSIRIRGERVADTLAFIDEAWRSFAPNSAIQRYFLSDTFQDLLEPDEKAGAMFTLFVGIALSVACLGLFGLAIFTAERRTKEIGVRKVFGGRTRDMVRLLLWRISIPVLIANAIAWPIAYWYLRNWLDGYAYRISLGPSYFMLGSVAALAIAWVTVFAHALRLARANPIHALRYE